MALALASRYARAMSDIVLKPSAAIDPQTAVAELHVFEKTLAGLPELRNVLLSPAVSPARKRTVVARVCEMLGVSPLTRNFLYVVVDHRRTPLLPEIREAFQALLDERMGVAEATVASARELTEDERQALGAQLGRLTGKTVRCRYSLEKDLIGGVTVKIGSTRYDGSVRGQLQELRRRLVE